MKRIFVSLFLLALAFPVISVGRLETSYFSRLPQIERPSLSPDGKYLAFIQNVPDTETAVLSSIEVKTGKRVELLKVNNDETKFSWFTWANNRSLFVKYWNANNIGVYDVTLAKAIVLEADGSHEEIREFDDARFIIDYLPDEPDWVLVEDGNQSSRVNIYTLKRKRHERRVRKMYDYITDQQHNIRVGTSNTNKRTGKIKIYVRPQADSSWEELFAYTNFDGTLFEPMGFGLDTNILYYKAYNNDKKALFKVELDTMTHSLVFADPTYDFDGSLLYSPKTRDIVGITHSNATSGRIYWNRDRKKLQRSIDLALPSMNNYILNLSKDENTYLVYTESDHIPGSYFLGFRNENELIFLFNQYPELAEFTEKTKHQLIKYKARDGIEIEGYLSLPFDMKARLPLIVHPHGGPESRDFSGFDYWTSFFVNLGYAVFRPNFRGSSGYGYSFARSQMQAWGLSMQDDITDGVNRLIQDNIVDKDKICIVGASYGGYAAAMAAIKTPELFKCSISFAGVMNLKELVHDYRHSFFRRQIEKRLGEDNDDLKARSPYYLAEKVNIPILLAHGEDDRRVKIEQSQEMFEKLQELGKDVTYLKLNHGDHYLSVQKNRHQLFKAMETFLTTHLSTTSE